MNAAGLYARPTTRPKPTDQTRGLNTRLQAQQLVVRKAEAEYHIARLAREIAEIEIQAIYRVYLSARAGHRQC